MESIDIWAPSQAGGTLSFNANDSYVVAGSGNPPNNYDCSFVSNPGEILPPYANSSGATASEFADGTSNSLASLTSTGLGCDSALAAGSGYSTSGVQYGSGDAQSYLITTGLVSSATGIVPVGGMSTCNLLEQASAPPKLLVSTLATLTAGKKTTVGYVKVTNTSQADCDIEVSMTAVSDAACSLSLAPSNPTAGDSLGDPSNVINVDFPTGDVTDVAQPTCTCSTSTPADSITSTMYVSSEGCWLVGANTATDKGGTPLSYTITCKN